MLDHFRDMDPNIERILDMGFSPPKDSRNLSLEEKKNPYLEAQASNVLVDFVSNAVILAIIPFRSAPEFWTKIQDKYDMSNNIEDDCIPSTSGHDELSSTSPKCSKTQGNSMVSGDGNCNVDSELTCDDHLSLSHCHASALDLNTSSTINALHACVYSPCISSASCMNKSHDDMLDLSCFHDTNISTSSSCCVSNNVEENKYSMGQDKILIREVSLAHLVREVDVQPSHPGSSPHGCRFGFLLFKNKTRCRGFPYCISFKKRF
jgi:hypothetical protein